MATAFVALVAPLVFSTIYEYPILLVAGIGALALLPGPGGSVQPSIADEADEGPGGWSALRAIALRLIPLAAVGAILLLLVGGEPTVARPMLALLLVGGLIVLLARSPALLAGGTALAVVILGLGLAPPSLTQVRTFFGVIEVRLPGGPAYAQYSGPTLHGAQFTDGRSREPTTYYVRNGPLGGVFDDLRARTQGASIGVVGLGVGTVAAYTQRNDSLAFFEIDQAIVDMAEDGKYFTYLKDSAAKPRVVVGDGRLSLEAEPDASLDLLVLDAFSSDAVPAHLLTREAMELYMQKLRPGGILAFHVSNRYYDLASAVASTAKAAGLGALDLQYSADIQQLRQIAAYDSEWVVVGRPDDVRGSRPVAGRPSARAPCSRTISRTRCERSGRSGRDDPRDRIRGSA